MRSAALSEYTVFYDDVAKEIGVDAAIVMNKFAGWINHNKLQNHTVVDGVAWTYNTVIEWQRDMPYYTADQLRRIIKKLRDSGWLVAKEMNAKTYDHTLWYTLGDRAKFLYGRFDLAISPDRIGATKPVDLSEAPNQGGDNAYIDSAISPYRFGADAKSLQSLTPISNSESSSGNDADASTPHAAPMEKTDSQIAEEKIQRLSDMIYKAYAKHTESKLADVSIRAILKAGTATPNSIPKTAMWLLERTECYAAKCRPHMKDPYFLKSIQSPSRWFTPPKGQSECRRYLGTDEEWDREIQIKLDIAARKRQHDERLGCSLDVKKELKAFPPTLKHPISLDDFRESHTPDAASTNDALGIEYARILFAAFLAVVFELPDRQARTHAIKFAAAFAKIFEVVKTLEDTDTPDVEFWEPVNSYIEDMRRSDSRFGPHLIPTTGLWFTNWLRAYCDAVEGFATYKGIMDELAKQTGVN